MSILSKQMDFHNNSFKSVEIKWKEDSRLKRFLNMKCDEKDRSFTYLQVLKILKDVITSEKLFDPKNPAIILCDDNLEQALDQKALHVSQLNAAIIPHLANSEQIEFPQVFHNKNSTDHGKRFFGNPMTEFSMQPNLLNLIRELAGPNNTKSIFSVTEILNLVSHYIISNRSTIFDSRNITLALVKNNLLGKALDVAAFHRSQIRALLDKQLICTSLKQEAAWTIVRYIKNPADIHSLQIPRELKNILTVMRKQS